MISHGTTTWSASNSLLYDCTPASLWVRIVPPITQCGWCSFTGHAYMIWSCEPSSSTTTLFFKSRIDGSWSDLKKSLCSPVRRTLSGTDFITQTSWLPLSGQGAPQSICTCVLASSAQASLSRHAHRTVRNQRTLCRQRALVQPPTACDLHCVASSSSYACLAPSSVRCVRYVWWNFNPKRCAMCEGKKHVEVPKQYSSSVALLIIGCITEKHVPWSPLRRPYPPATKPCLRIIALSFEDPTWWIKFNEFLGKILRVVNSGERRRGMTWMVRFLKVHTHFEDSNAFQDAGVISWSTPCTPERVRPRLSSQWQAGKRSEYRSMATDLGNRPKTRRCCSLGFWRGILQHMSPTKEICEMWMMGSLSVSGTGGECVAEVATRIWSAWRIVRPPSSLWSMHSLCSQIVKESSPQYQDRSNHFTSYTGRNS